MSDGLMSLLRRVEAAGAGSDGVGVSGSRHTPDPRAPLKRSPGPWVVTHRHVDGTAYDDEISGLGLEIEAIERPLIRGDYALAGDAHLIAAAPELLEALKALVRVNEEHNAAMGVIIKQPVTWKDTYLDAARAAIARAEGTEP